MAASRSQTDVDALRVGAIYAEALLGTTEDTGSTGEVLAELDSLIDNALDAFPTFEVVLNSHIIAHEKKKGIIDRVFGQRASPLVLSFLKVLSAHGRLNCLRVIVRVAHELHDEIRGRVNIELVSAAPLDMSLQTELAAKLQAMLGLQPQIKTNTDPELVGGIVLRVGDKVYDGSVASELARMRSAIVKRSVQEFQSGRDRFRSASRIDTS